jgi:hypothetical protein
MRKGRLAAAVFAAVLDSAVVGLVELSIVHARLEDCCGWLFESEGNSLRDEEISE